MPSRSRLIRVSSTERFRARQPKFNHHKPKEVGCAETETESTQARRSSRADARSNAGSAANGPDTPAKRARTRSNGRAREIVGIEE